MSTMTVVCFCLHIFFMVHFAAGSEDFPICSSDQHVIASVGDTALLSCHFSYGEATKNLTVIWRKEIEEAPDIVVYNQSKREASNNQSATYLDRTAMYEDWFQHKDASLAVHRIRPVDAGKYSCWIVQSGSPMTTYECCTITLGVAEKWKDDKIQVVVAWSTYVIFLSLCLLFLHTCRQYKSLPDKGFEV